MKYIASASLLVIVVCVANAQKPSDRPDRTDDRVVVNTNLVQVDAVVTDKDNKPVTNLQPDDFELIENGQVRQIAGFSYVNLLSNQKTRSAPTSPIQSLVSTSPPSLHAARPEDVRRAVAIIVDDFGLSFESIARLRTALEKYVLTSTLPNDFIAVIRTSGGPGSIQQFTSNKAQIIATIRRIRWYPTGRGRMSAIDSIQTVDHDGNGLDLQGYSTTRPPDLSAKEFMGGSLGSLYFVVEGLSRFPGRKSIVLISENLPLTTRESLIGGSGKALEELTKRANRFGIVISTIDARGLPKAGLTADDNVYDLAANQVDKRSMERRITFRVQQDTLSYLAEETGGLFVQSSNDLTFGLRKTIDSEQGYYLLAFRPDDNSNDQSRTYKVTLRLKRPDLLLRSRSTFAKAVAPLPESHVETKVDVLRQALSSPFVKEDLKLKLTALFTGNSQVRVLLHINPADLEMTRSASGAYTNLLDIAAVAFDDNGKVAQQVRQTRPLDVPAQSYEQFMRDGIVYALTLPLRNSGPYQIRVAVTDSSGRVGSDSQFVDVPDVEKSRLAVAGFMVHGADGDQPTVQRTPGSGGTPAGPQSIKRNPGVRQFRAGDLLQYSYLIYGVRPNEFASSNVVSQMRLFRNADAVFVGEVIPVSGQSSKEGMLAGGSLRLGSDLPAGEYFLQVIVTDKSAPADRQTIDQWIDFEIVRDK